MDATILALVKNLSDFKIDDLNIIHNNSDTVYQLYRDIENNILKNDDDVLNRYFKGNPNARKYYWRLKKQLYNRLANSFILAPQKNTTPIQEVYFEVYRNYFIINELFGRGQSKAATLLAERTIDKAIKFDIADIIASLARKLVLQYSTVAANPKKYKKYSNIVTNYSLIRNAEEDIERLFCDLALKVSQKRRINPDTIKSFEKEINKINTLFINYPTQKIAFYYYTIQTLLFEIKDDLWNTLHYCKEALQFFQENFTASPKGMIFNFLHKQINIQIRLKQFEKANNSLKACLEFTPKGSSNWYIVNNYKVILAFHSGDYIQAHHIIKEVSLHRKNMNETMIEHWKILKAYAYLMSPNGHNFRLGKFLNEVPFFSKDKRGHNTNILILQILFLLEKNRHDEIINKVESLKQYVSKYLRKDDTFRTSCFIKMLCQIPLGNFHPINVERRTKHYYEKMMKLPKEQARMDVDVEIIPYEVLWSKVIALIS